MAAMRHISHSLALRRVALVVVVSIIIVSSAVLVDVNLAGCNYELDEPSISHDFPETIYFYNISDGVTFNTFSFIFELTANHSGHNHIVPREISLIFWFRDSDSTTGLSQFIAAVQRGLWNSTVSMNNYWPYHINSTKGDWWTPSRTWFAFNEEPSIGFLRFGIAFEIILVNSFGHSFDGHELNVQLEMNVTYSRWWFAERVSDSHQVVTYTLDVPEDGTTVIQSLEYGTS